MKEMMRELQVSMNALFEAGLKKVQQSILEVKEQIKQLDNNVEDVQRPSYRSETRHSSVSKECQQNRKEDRQNTTKN